MNGGEISPRALGRFDVSKFVNGLKIALNFLIHQVGGAFFRPGSKYVATTKTVSLTGRLIPFQYSTTQGYIVELGNLYFRYYTQKAQLISGSAVETVTPYLTADLMTIQYTQNENTQYLVHGSYAPHKHTRTSSTAFAMNAVNFVRGPFLDANISKVLLTATAATGSTTVTASAPAWASGTSYIIGPDQADYVVESTNTYKCLIAHTGGTFATDLAAGKWVLVASAANQPSLFQAGHLGSLWRLKDAVFKITAVTNSYTVAVDVQAEPTGAAGNIGSTSALTDWAEGAFSGFRGYPTAVVFHSQRLYYGKGQIFYGSVIGQFDNFDKGTTTNDTNAVIFKLGSDQANVIRWLASAAQALQNGTSGGTFSANPAGSAASITATSIQVSDDTAYGVSTVRPSKVSSSLYYIQKSGFSLRELLYNYLVNRQVTTDMNELADHILRDGGGAIDMAYQQTPMDRLWVVRADGQIAVLTRNTEQKVAGWSRVVMGRSLKGEGTVESIAVLQNDADDDEIWVIVKRVINGATTRFVEYFTPEYFTDDWDAIRLDAALTYDSPKTITAITSASPGVVTAASHGLSDGDQIKIDKVKGVVAVQADPTDPAIGTTDDMEVNGRIYYVGSAAANTFALLDADGANVSTEDMLVYLSGGEVRKMVTAISGLSHLEGETVSVQVDGAIPSGTQTYTVASGAITLAQKAAVVHVGLPYIGTVQFLKFSEGADAYQAGATGQTKMRRIYLSILRFYKTLGGRIGREEGELNPFVFQNVNDPQSESPALFTGDYEQLYDTAWRTDDEVIIRQDVPAPMFILAAFFRTETEESF